MSDQTDAPLSSLILDFIHWLASDAIQCSHAEELIAVIGAELNTRGVPVFQFSCGMPVLHPQVGGRTLNWQRGWPTAQETLYGHGASKSTAFQSSPVHFILRNKREMLRRRLVGEDAVLDYAILTELREQGATDYLALSPRLRGVSVGFMRWTSDAANGFSDDDVAFLRQITPHLAIVLEVHLQRLISQTLLGIYLSADAGSRVLGGQIRLGDLENIDAVIWFSDLRGFTKLSESLPREELIQALNACFDAQVTAIHHHQGEVLKFIGDGLLAIFRIGDSHLTASEACTLAFEAAMMSMQGLSTFNQTERPSHWPPLRIGLALHVGEVGFGNIGSSQRLDFTAIGSAVNIASRMENLCKPTQQDLLLSDEFVRAWRPQHGWHPTLIGTFPLSGVSEEQTVFTANREESAETSR